MPSPTMLKGLYICCTYISIMRVFTSCTVDAYLHTINNRKLSLAIDVGLIILNTMTKDDVVELLENVKIKQEKGYKMSAKIDEIVDKVKK